MTAFAVLAHSLSFWLGRSERLADQLTEALLSFSLHLKVSSRQRPASCSIPSFRGFRFHLPENSARVYRSELSTAAHFCRRHWHPGPFRLLRRPQTLPIG